MQSYYVEIVNFKTEQSVKGVIQHRNIQHFMNTLAEHNLYAPSCIPVSDGFNLEDVDEVGLGDVIDIPAEELEPIK